MPAGHPITPSKRRKPYKARLKDCRCVCLHCGEPFVGQLSQDCCSHKCNVAAWRKANRPGRPAHAECIRCGKSLAIPKRGPLPKYCGRDCRRGRDATTHVCPCCGKNFTARPDAHHRRYCSRACQLKPHPRTCPCCGEQFLGRKSARYCGPECAARGRSVPRPERRKNRHARTCIGCGVEYTPTRADNRGYCSHGCNAKVDRTSYLKASEPGLYPCKGCGQPVLGCETRFCSDECRAEHRAHDCVLCGKSFQSAVPAAKYCSRKCRFQGSHGARRRRFDCLECGEPFTIVTTSEQRPFCSPRCGHRAGQRARRHRVHAAYVEHVGLGFLVKRDKGICRLCGEPVDVSASVPDPMAPTIDHVVPVARGGEHSLANTQLAHFSCNVAKSDSLPEARGQMLLF